MAQSQVSLLFVSGLDVRVLWNRLTDPDHSQDFPS